MFRRALTAALAATAAGSMLLALSGVAHADDAQRCTGVTVTCTGDVVNVRDLTTAIHDVALHLFSDIPV